MIVMKFGGASLASPVCIRRVAGIVLSEINKAAARASSHEGGTLQNPVVVASAIGDTTDQLLRVLDHASRAESYLAWKLQEQLKIHHFCLAEDLLSPEHLDRVDEYIRLTFRDLHVRILEVCRGERLLDPELRDWVASLGEKLSSRILAAALADNGIPTKHMESEKLILTDDRFSNATPRYWETYARIRWSVPFAARTHVVVVEGFVGATEDGRTTTLGCGGSDLTASIIGAAVNADEIQLWKDVDGMLTWDPRIRTGASRVRSLSYEEVDELSRGGGTILHPETIAPAQRLRIPMVIRNTFRPEGEGTRIGPLTAVCANPVKSIACKANMTLVALRSPTARADIAELLSLIQRVCREQKAATFLAASDDVIYLALDADTRVPEVEFVPGHCLQAHIRSGQVIITLAGEALRERQATAGRLTAALAQRSAVILPQNGQSCALQIAVPQERFVAASEILQNMFFSDLDPLFFAPVDTAAEEQAFASDPKMPVSEKQQVFSPHTRGFVLSGIRL